jgi:hypothetical protein
MAEPLVITLAHTLGKDEVLRRLQPGLSSLTGQLPMLTIEDESWQGDELTFRARALGQAASGSVLVADDHVRIRVQLPWLLHQMADGLATAIKARGRLLLENKSQQT